MKYKRKTHDDAHGFFQNILKEKLLLKGVDEATISNAINSGYYSTPWHNDTVFDSFYGTSWASVANIGIEGFVRRLHGDGPSFKKIPEVHYISSIDEIQNILSSTEQSKYYLDNGFLSFRGQTKEYFTERPIPNPTMTYDGGKERLIIPGIWRKYYPDFNRRHPDGEYFNFFSTILADDIIYSDIPDFQTLGDRNFEKYGYHTMSDLEDFPEWENKEYYRRWWAFKVAGNQNNDLAIVGQHYGLDTTGLDVTFNYKTAGFFAANKFVQKDNGKATYHPIARHEGVIYCFYFRAPTLTSTKDIIKDLESFQHLNAVRPIRQECALPFFLYDSFNEASHNLYKVFYLKSDFSSTGISAKEYLFPTEAEDPFYKTLMESKRRNVDSEFHKSFVEYDFT